MLVVTMVENLLDFDVHPLRHCLENGTNVIYRSIPLDKMSW